MGLYKIVKSGNENYESDNDIDGIDDGTISVTLDLTKTASTGNDFNEKPQEPLPVRLKNIHLTSKGNQQYNLSWEAASEIN